MIDVVLRPMRQSDLELLTGGDAVFSDWGPSNSKRLKVPFLGESGGGLTIDSDGEVAGDLSWVYAETGPGGSSRVPNAAIWLRASHRGRGIGASAQRQLAELFFRHTNINRLEATTDVDNIAEQKALERAGFTREGVLRGWQWRDGTYHDMCMYSVLRSDHPGSWSPTV